MAIKLSKTDNKGVITRYHRVAQFTVFEGTIHATVESYVNDRIRKIAGETQDLAYSKQVYLLDYNGTDALNFEEVYTRLLAVDEFKGGEKI